MVCTVLAAAMKGLEVQLVHVETDMSNGLPAFQMVGYLSNEVREAKERVRTAIRNAGFYLPAKRITVNISPADFKKHGSAYDLPVAITILAAMGIIPAEKLRGVLIIGEISLEGRVNEVPGILPIVMAAKEYGCRVCIVPEGNSREGGVVEGIDVIGVSSIIMAIRYLNEELEILPEFLDLEELLVQQDEIEKTDFSEVIGQPAAKRAAEIAVSGHHHLLMAGAPGAGKTMIAKRIPGILPDLTPDECVEISRIYSVTGALTNKVPLITRRPFRNPHHTVTARALIGGGRYPKPGEISLAHHGVLFLSELPEFKSAVLDGLRQPLEEKEVKIIRNLGSYVYPADCLLIADMNPCKCGFYPDMNRCTCSWQSVSQYLGKISRPLLDRMDLCVEVAPVKYEELAGNFRAESSAEIRKRVNRTRAIQRERFTGTGIRCNGDMKVAHIKKYCRLYQEEKEYMEQIFHRLQISARVYHKILKVARTIADMEAAERICKEHISEAVCYRMADYKFWNMKGRN